VTNTRRSSGLNLVEMTKQIKPRPAAAVIQLTLGQNSEDRTLTGINVTQYRKPKVNKLQCTKKQLYLKYNVKKL